MAGVHCKKIVIKVLCLCVVAKPSCSVSNSPQLENTESLRDSPISSATSGAQSPGNGSHTWLLKVFVVFKDILKKIRSSEISFFLALQKKSWWKKLNAFFFSFQFFMLHHSLLLIGYCRDLKCWPAFLIDFILFYLPGADAAAESELLCLSSPVDLLCGPVPSCLPSPQLHPDPVVVQQADLIHFEERTPPLPTGGPSDLCRFCGIKLKGSVLFAPFPSVVKCELVCLYCLNMWWHWQTSQLIYLQSVMAAQMTLQTPENHHHHLTQRPSCPWTVPAEELHVVESN